MLYLINASSIVESVGSGITDVTDTRYFDYVKHEQCSIHKKLPLQNIWESSIIN